MSCRSDSPEAIEVVQTISDYLLDRKEKIFYETRISQKFIAHFRKNLDENRSRKYLNSLSQWEGMAQSYGLLKVSIEKTRHQFWELI